jgi:hypothetical protein
MCTALADVRVCKRGRLGTQMSQGGGEVARDEVDSGSFRLPSFIAVVQSGDLGHLCSARIPSGFNKPKDTTVDEIVAVEASEFTRAQQRSCAGPQRFHYQPVGFYRIQ